MKSRPVNETINQMEFLGHDFFFFYSSVTGEYSVLYRRVN